MAQATASHRASLQEGWVATVCDDGGVPVADVAVVTGVCRGIGRLPVAHLARRGSTVVAVSPDHEFCAVIRLFVVLRTAIIGELGRLGSGCG
jgi:hypothetical protein